jgi:hypothetical protein
MSTTPTQAAIDAAAFGLAYHDYRRKQIDAVQLLARALAHIDPTTGEPVFTQAELARQAGISRPAVSQLSQQSAMIIQRGKLGGYLPAELDPARTEDVA